MIAARAKTVRQPAASAINPLMVREARMPVSVPDPTIPTIRPRWASPARSPASGVRNLPGNRRHAEEAQCDDEDADRRRQRTQQQCGGRGQQQQRDESAAIQDVAERHEQQHPDRVPALRCGHEPSGRLGRGVQIACDEAEQRLRAVQVGDGRPGRNANRYVSRPLISAR